MAIISPSAPALAPLQETILAILPFPEATEIFNRIRTRHPHSKIIYYTPPGIAHVSAVERYWREDIPIPSHLYASATILLTLKTLPLPSEAPNLKLVHLFSAGINHISSHPLWTSSKVQFTNSSGIHAPQIAEHVFATLLALTHRLPTLLQWQKESHWGSHASSGGYFSSVSDLAGATMGILGYGAIGRQVGRVANALGMRVLAYTATPRETAESRRDRSYAVGSTGDRDGSIPEAWYSGLNKTSLRAFLEEGIDVLVIGVPLTAATHKLLGPEELAILERPRRGGKGAYVVNIARGGIIDHDALIASLKRGLADKEGGLAGASLDVTDPEPLGSESELWGLGNCIITPHVSGSGSGYMERCLEVLEENLVRLEEGGELMNMVEREKGY